MPRKPTVYFVDGLVRDRNYFAVVAYLHEFEDEPTEFTRIYTYDQGEWEHYETNSQVVSCARAIVDGVATYFFLGRRGEVRIIDKDGERDELITGPGTGARKLGYVSQIREIGGEVYVCGANRQVYHRRANGWAAVHGNILTEPVEEVKASFASIHGTGPSDIYAVGKKGEIFHFNGKRWRQCDSPTNLWLERVLCMTKDLVYICGQNATLLRGSGDEWEVITYEDLEDENFWGLTIYDGDAHVAYDRGILRLRGDELVPLSITLKPAPEFSRLYAVENVLYSFGGHDIVRYDGKKWMRIICPDNA